MTPEEYKAKRKALQLSQEELAGVLDVHKNQVWRREKGKTPISTEAAMAIKWCCYERFKEMIKE
jgi:transcriptional regulator with XRE-family HTH domain